MKHLAKKHLNLTRTNPPRNLFHAEAEVYKVTLIGNDKNPDAIGSRLFIEKDNTKLFRTIKSGSGYLSQSTNQITVSNEFVGGNIIIEWPNSKKTTHVIPANTENFMISY